MSEQEHDKADGQARPRRLELKKTVETGQVRQSFSHGRSKTVTVEVKKKRTIVPGKPGHDAAHAPAQPPATPAPAATASAPTAAPAAAAPAPTPAPVPVAEAAPPAPAPEKPAVAAPAEPPPAPPVVAAAPAPTPAAAPAAPIRSTPAPAAQAGRPASAPPPRGAAAPGRPGAGPGRRADDTRRTPPRTGAVLRQLTDEEKAARVRALEDSKKAAEEARRRAEEDARRRAEEEARAAVEREAAAKRAAEEEARKRVEDEARRKAEDEARRRMEQQQAAAGPAGEPRPQGDRPYGDRGPRPQGDRPYGDRPPRPQGDRPYGDRPPRPQGDRPPRPQGDRPYGDRPPRPQGDRTYGDRPPRPPGDRPYGDRPPRPPGDRPFGDRGPRPGGPGAGPRPDFTPPAATDDSAGDRERRRRAAGGGGKPGGSAAAPPRPAPAKTPARTKDDSRRGKLTISTALNEEERVRSLAAFKRAREREKRLMQQAAGLKDKPAKVVRDIVIPETITVQELAARMAERGVDVVKTLMKMGVMATINQTIDADTAELVAGEFGHRFRRVTEADIEIGIAGEVDEDEHRLPRPPVVTIMGHVDHGKTSLLDALRETDVASREAGGITQHIGAYQVTLRSGQKITFLDTPGHEAFTAMRARGAKVTDIVVLVVAADDSVMPQTVEAIRHARAAGVPIIVAINKCDKPQANPNKVRQELLQHEIVVEQLGGDVQTVEVSAKAKTNLDKLEEAILLQAEILDLRANPDRAAEGNVVEAKLDRGRGSVATVLVRRGTLRVGDIFVAGSEWGRVRALVDERGRNVEEAGPAVPVEVLGLQGTPEAGDEFVVVDTEAKARQIAEFRQRRQRDQRVSVAARGTLEQMFSKIKAGESKELPIVVKTDVQGSLEAILGAAQKLGTDEVQVRILHGAVGAINESDVTLAAATKGLIIGFNVRASKQARDMAGRDGVDIRYYSIIYDVTDDLKGMLSGMLAPMVRENFLGYAEIREIFTTSKSGRVAGCMVTEGIVRRGAKVRLLRDNVVVHEGSLSTLRRFKDEVREVKEGFECGMAFETYQDIQKGDVIECFELESVARQL